MPTIYIGITGIKKLIKDTDNLLYATVDAAKMTFKEQAALMEDVAKMRLEQASQTRTGKRYWTGKLQNAIKSNITEENKNNIKASIGVDTDNITYAEWVETGHSKRDGEWWEGYHYMESAFLEVAKEMDKKIAYDINLVIKSFDFTPWGTRNPMTGRFTKGRNFIWTD